MTPGNTRSQSLFHCAIGRCPWLARPKIKRAIAGRPRAEPKPRSAGAAMTAAMIVMELQADALVGLHGGTADVICRNSQAAHDVIMNSTILRATGTPTAR